MTSKHISKGMLLAAGFGKRLQPLTNTMPKPLVPLDGKRLIDFSLEYFARHGIKEVIVNLHHLGDQIEAYVANGYRYKLHVTYSYEKTILGTGGGIKKASPFFQGETFVCLNADTLIECDLEKVIAHHFAQEADATMVLRSLQKGDSFQPVTLNSKGFVSDFHGKGKHFYTGLQIIGPKLVDILPSSERASCLINDGYIPLIKAQGKVASFIQTGYWNDLGTMERYEQAKKDFQKK